VTYLALTVWTLDGPNLLQGTLPLLGVGGAYHVRVNMASMRVLVVELICKVVTRRIPVLECLSVRSAWAPMAMSYRARH
jgi:hypothetical protein